MCGIAGIYSDRGEIPAGAVLRMTDALVHRGPDSEGFAHFDRCQLGHRRLSIIDLSGGQQPMADPTGRFTVTFNGEIFNFRDLRDDLEARGYVFRTKSDTEVLLVGYQEHGVKLPERLNGQFAFAIWDNREKTLFLARDRFGEKPLYCATGPKGEFLFASELKGLLASNLVTPALNRSAVDFYLRFLHVPPHRTIYANIHVLPPAHAMCVGPTGQHSWRYWSPQYSQRTSNSAADLIDEVGHAIRQAVSRQMCADVPLGAFLSGGLDSTAIVGHMSSLVRFPVRTFSVGFGDLINELPYARSAAARFNTEHHEVQMDVPVGELLERLATVYDEPLADSSNLPTYMIAGYARQFVTVALSGDGGDEIFGGYDWYRHFLNFGDRPGQTPWQTLGAYAIWRVACRMGVATAERRDAARSRHLAACYPDPWDQRMHQVRYFEDRQLRSLWGVQTYSTDDDDEFEALRPQRGIDGLDRQTDFDLNFYMPGDILVKVDRAAMAHSLEVRSPFLDVDLAELILSIPWRQRVAGGELKWALRRACADIYPPEIQNRPKMGFGAPVAAWTQRSDVRSLIARVDSAGSPLRSLFPRMAPIESYRSAQQRWTLLVLGLWLESRTSCLS